MPIRTQLNILHRLARQPTIPPSAVSYAQLVRAMAFEYQVSLADRILSAVINGNRKTLLCAISDFLEFGFTTKKAEPELKPTIKLSELVDAAELEAYALAVESVKTLRTAINNIDDERVLAALEQFEAGNQKRKSVLISIDKRRKSLATTN